MKKSQINPAPKYFDRYINLFDDQELDAAFRESEAEFDSFDWEKCREIGLNIYAPGKWTIPDVLQHLLDWERIMTYRALGFARGMFQTAPGHDENLMAENAGASARSLEEILDEMKTLRASTRQFFLSLSESQMLQPGICWEAQMSPLALAFTILGHQRHHFRILQERYFSM
ncbi:MAG TPA: DinB family protein [Saprospiraceae bacterium]|nr:DinB family protein [Saprospiraceae bacterium]